MLSFALALHMLRAIHQLVVEQLDLNGEMNVAGVFQKVVECLGSPGLQLLADFFPINGRFRRNHGCPQSVSFQFAAGREPPSSDNETHFILLVS